MIFFLALSAILALAFAAPTARSDATTVNTNNNIAPRAYFQNSVITNPDALTWYHPTGDDKDNTNNNGPSQNDPWDLTRTYALNNDVTPSGITSTYRCFTNDNYPPISDWLPFETLWTYAASVITSNNPSTTLTAPTGASIVSIIHDKILAVAASTHLDARLILAIILQESSGILSTHCTSAAPDGTPLNCGIMQGPPGSRPYDPQDPAASIETMLRDGVQGHDGIWPAGGPGLAYWMGVYGAPWPALRAYNSGSVPDPTDLRVIGQWGKPAYVVDVANRLVGWDAVAEGRC